MPLSRSDRTLLTLAKTLVAIAAILVGLVSLIHHLIGGLTPELRYYLFAEVAVITGGAAVLVTTVMPLRWPYWLGIVLAGPAGTAVGLLVLREQIGCMFCYSQSRGYPFRWLSRGIDYETNLPLPAARTYLEANTDSAPWRLDTTTAMVNVFVWAAAALAVVVIVKVVFLAVRRPSAPDPALDPAPVA